LIWKVTPIHRPHKVRRRDNARLENITSQYRKHGLGWLALPAPCVHRWIRQDFALRRHFIIVGESSYNTIGNGDAE
jgi:hypothetical protein